MKNCIEHRRHFSACRLLMLAGLLWVCPSTQAQFIVTSLADSGPGTLREHIRAAKDGDSIDFSVTGTITLSSQLVISNGITITGPGARFLKVSGNNTSRVFHLKSGGTIITRLTIADGRVMGANGPVGLDGEDVMGGGILVASGADGSLDYVVVTNNVAVGGRGGAQNQFGSSGNGGNGFGAGIANLGTLTLRECSLAGNSALGGLGGPVSGGMSPGVGGQGWGGGLYSGGGWPT